MTTEAVSASATAIQKAFQPDARAQSHTEHRYLPHDGVDVGKGTITATVAPPSSGDGGLPADTLREMYWHMALARALDERMWQLNRAGHAPFVVSGQGHEATQVAAAFALDRTKDILVPYYRDLALCLVWGLTPRDILLSVLARAEDPTSGARQMPAHYSSAKLRIVSGSSVVATQLPHATGTAYAAKLRRTGQVTLVCFGEGGSSKGDFHEACNFAGIHKLPVIFLCENNHYAISVPIERQVAIDNVADRAAGYGFPGVVVDGTDLLAVYQVCREAADRARRGEGPTLIEAKVYRFNPHSSDDDDRTYRSPEEVRAWRNRDPLLLWEKRLRDLGILDDQAIADINGKIKQVIDDATDYAERAPLPDPATFDRFVYAEHSGTTPAR